MSADPLFSIIIVNYNGENVIGQCADSIFNHVQHPFELIIFDNASSDSSLALLSAYKKHANFRLIESPENLGFAKGNNRAADQAKGKFLHFLNPDTIVDDSINQCYEVVIKSGEGNVFVTKLLEEDGSPQLSKHPFPFIGNYLKKMFSPSKAEYWYLGASIIFSKEDFEKAGKWPEDYFMYAEDMDLFYRSAKAGLNIQVLESSIRHIGKGTTSSVWDESKRQQNIERSLKRFYRKYGKVGQYYCLRLIQIPSKFIRFKPDAFRQLKAFLKVNFGKAD